MQSHKNGVFLDVILDNGGNTPKRVKLREEGVLRTVDDRAISLVVKHAFVKVAAKALYELVRLLL